MQVSFETLKGLERKVTISVPTDKIEEEVSLRLKNLARNAKVQGFRPGKAPMNIVVQRYADGVREEVARDMMQSTLFEALKDKDLNPADYPQVEIGTLEKGKDFEYSATFEVFPQFEVHELNKADVEVVEAVVSDKDLDAMMEKLREQNKTWHAVSRTCQNGDKVRIDFEGFLDGVPFEGGRAEGHELVLGSGSMIPGFEEGITGKETGKPFEISVTFPADYGHKDLAGKATTFNITVHEVMESKLPELDDAFAEQFNILEGGIEALKKDIRENMERELSRRLKALNRETTFTKLLEKNAFDLPNALIEREIGHLKHEMYHRLFGPEHSEHEQIPDFPRELFEAQAKRRVHLGLLFAEYVKKHELVADKARVDAIIDSMASAYEHPEQLRAWYASSKERMGEVEALALEELVAEKILEDANCVKKVMDYESVMNPKKGTENAGE